MDYRFWTKVLNRVSLEKNRLWRYLPIKVISHWGLRPLQNKFLFKHKLQSFLGEFDKKQYAFLSEDLKNRIIEQGEQILLRRYDLLGSGLVNLDPLEWDRDFKSGFCWPKGRFYRKYQKVDLLNDADVKVPWELSRGHQLLWLGQAYLFTENEEYAKEVVYQIENWIDENPLMYSINWTCTMDVAIRSVNWLYAVNMIIDSKYISQEFIQKIYVSLFEHGFFIFNNLEKSIPYSANHYASNIVGLLYLGQLFSNTSRGNKWWKFGLSEYFAEVRNQVLPSGVHFEKSISYHRLMTEFFGYSYILLIKLGETIPLDIHSRIQSMFEFIANYTKPNGLSPIVGDNDNGRFLPFINEDFRDHRYLLGIANGIFKSLVFSKFNKFGWVEMIFLNVDRYDNALINSDLETPLQSKVYKDAGIAILREAQNYLIFANTGLSRYPESHKGLYGTHTHADALSFELSIGEFDFIIDPGSYLYTSSKKLRNEFRATTKHNTVVVDDLSQNTFVKSNLFLVKNFEMPLPIEYIKNPNGDTIKGQFVWPNGVVHTRQINCNEASFVIEDMLTSSKPHKYELYYHFAPDLEISMGNGFIEVVAMANIKLKMSFSCDTKYSCQIFNDTVSPSYGVILPSKTLKISIERDSSILNFVTNLEI